MHLVYHQNIIQRTKVKVNFKDNHHGLEDQEDKAVQI